MKNLILLIAFAFFASSISAQTTSDTTVWGDIDHNYSGGQQAYRKYVSQNVRYPAVAWENNIQGCVYLKLTINPDSTIGNVKIYAGIGSGADEESTRVIKIGQKWIPSRVNDIPVKTWCLVPVQFRLVPSDHSARGLAGQVLGAPWDSVKFAAHLAFESSGISLGEAKGYMYRHISFVGKVYGVKKLSDTLLVLTCGGLYATDYVNIALMGPAVQPKSLKSLPGYFISGHGTVTKSGGTPVIIITEPKDYALKEHL
ncbi:MAG TPA: energy transducer TonB [Mucilaginibacter sp.]|nr:energy transducer TonB [Mucilaginibacter sp.]